MISLTIKTPTAGDLIFSNRVVINYEVKDTEGIFNKVVFDVDGVLFEKTARSGLFEITVPEGDHVLVAYVKNKYGKEIISTRNTVEFSAKPITIELKNKLSSVVSSSIPDFLEQEYSAQQAFEMGMINAVVPHTELEDFAFNWAQAKRRRVEKI